MTDLKSINHEQRLYCIAAGNGYTCLGFDYAEMTARQVLAWLPVETRWHGITASDAALGTPEHFRFYCEVMAAGAAHNQKTGARCPAGLTSQLVGLEGKRVEVTTPSGDTSRYYVGKSTGWFPCHLEIKTRRSHCGAPVYFPDGARVRIVGTR